MKSKVMVVGVLAILSMSGLALAEEMAADAPTAPAQVDEQAKAAPIVVGNTKCPVCGVDIPAENLGKYTVEYNGKVYNVCSPSDHDMFMADVKRWGTMTETGVDPYSGTIPPKEPGAQASPDQPAAAPATEPN